MKGSVNDCISSAALLKCLSSCVECKRLFMCERLMKAACVIEDTLRMNKQEMSP